MTKDLGTNQKQTIIGTVLSCLCTFLFQTSIANTNVYYTIHESVSHSPDTTFGFKSELHILREEHHHDV